jgi:hypothetical protein
MFSGHFAFGLLMTLLAFKYNFVGTTAASVGVATLLNIIHFYIIAATRSHYTMDMVVSIYATLLVTLYVDSNKI